MKLIATLAAAATLAAQQTGAPQPPQQPPTRTQIFQLKYGDPARIVGLLGAFTNCGRNYDETLRTISFCGTAETIAAAEETIKRFDTPVLSRNIEVTAYLLIGSPDAAKKGELPVELAPVLKQLSGALSFKAYRLNETFLIRTRDGQGAEASSIGRPIGEDGQLFHYQFRFKRCRMVPDEKGDLIRFDDLRVGMRVPVRTGGSGPTAQYQFVDVGFNSDIDVRSGQKAVVGKANLDGNEAMIVVLVPRTVD